MKRLLLLLVPVSVATVLAFYSLFVLDNIVHGTLYDYGLHFSYEWANPYWTMLRTVQALIGLTTVFSVVSYLYMYRTYTHAKPVSHEELETEDRVKKETEREKKAVFRPITPTPSPPTREPDATQTNIRSVDENVNGLVKCNHCNRVFSQPLRMLDFHAERPRVVSICPFCNEVIQPVIRERESETVKKPFLWRNKKSNHGAEPSETAQSENVKSEEES